MSRLILKDRFGTKLNELDVVLADWGNTGKKVKSRPEVIQKIGVIIWDNKTACFDIALIGKFTYDSTILEHRDFDAAGDYRTILGTLKCDMIEGRDGYSCWPDSDNYRCNNLTSLGNFNLTLNYEEFGFTFDQVFKTISEYY